MQKGRNRTYGKTGFGKFGLGLGAGADLANVHFLSNHHQGQKASRQNIEAKGLSRQIGPRRYHLPEVMENKDQTLL